MGRIKALLLRSLHGSTKEKGRLFNEYMLPFSTLLIWGMLIATGVIPRDAGEIIVGINLVWLLAYIFQETFNLHIMYDMWSGEIGSILPITGIKNYMISKVIFMIGYSVVMGAAFTGITWALFGMSTNTMLTVIKSLPAVWIFSTGIAIAVAGIIFRYGMTYGFLSWTTMQFIVLISFPFSAPKLIEWLLPASKLVPLYYIFSIIRGESASLHAAYLLSAVWLVAGMLIFAELYKRALKNGSIMEITS